MPIDRATFTREFTLLLERFGKDPHQLMTARYFEYLHTRLTTPEFEHAARTIFAEDTYWPAPIRFLHAAKGDPAHLARQEFEALVEHAREGNLAPLTEAGKAALKAIGGWPTIAYAEEYRLPSVRKAFIESYTTPATSTAPAPLLEEPTRT